MISVDLANRQQPSVTVLLPASTGIGIGEMVQSGNFLYATTGSPALSPPSDLLIFDSTDPKELKTAGKLSLYLPLAAQGQ